MTRQVSEQMALPEHGYSAQTWALASALYRSDSERTALRRWLDIMESPIKYSNEDFDRKQGLASELADIIRRQVR
jgi:hypothetical protein